MYLTVQKMKQTANMVKPAMNMENAPVSLIDGESALANRKVSTKHTIAKMRHRSIGLIFPIPRFHQFVGR